MELVSIYAMEFHVHLTNFAKEDHVWQETARVWTVPQTLHAEMGNASSLCQFALWIVSIMQLPVQAQGQIIQVVQSFTIFVPLIHCIAEWGLTAQEWISQENAKLAKTPLSFITLRCLVGKPRVSAKMERIAKETFAKALRIADANEIQTADNHGNYAQMVNA